MPRPQKPYRATRRKDSKTFYLVITPASGLPVRVCQEWFRKSFQDLPDTLARYRNPKTKTTAENGDLALIGYLKKKQEEEGSARRVKQEDITVGAWLEKFTSLETNPRTGVNASKNRPYSPATIDLYKSYYEAHIKGDPFAALKMSESEEDDALEFSNRLSLKKLANGQTMGGTRTFAGVIIFVRMAFKVYQKRHARWLNPFQNLDPPESITGTGMLSRRMRCSGSLPRGYSRPRWNWPYAPPCFSPACGGRKFSRSGPRIWIGIPRRSPFGGLGKISTKRAGSWAPKREAGTGCPL